jgi:hypothetical protein
MKRKIWLNKCRSFKEAQEFDDAYYLAQSPQERLETVQFLREEYKKMKKGENYESGKGLRRVLKLIKQT